MRRLNRWFGTMVRRVLIWSLKQWANHYMDQFEKIRFKDSFGNDVFVSMSYYDEYPSTYEDV